MENAEYETLEIIIDEEKKTLIESRAKELGLDTSSYITWLVKRDILKSSNKSKK